MLLMLLMSFLLFMMLLILLNVDVVTVNLPGLHLNSYASHFAAGSSGFKAVVPSNTTCVKKRKKIGVHEIGQQDWYKIVHKNVISL